MACLISIHNTEKEQQLEAETQILFGISNNGNMQNTSKTKWKTDFLTAT
jgi:hypothetical protein